MITPRGVDRMGRRLFQKFVRAGRGGRPWRAAGTDFWNNRRKEAVPFVSKVHPSGPSRLSVHGPPPRPALTDFWNNRREESVPFVSKVYLRGPSRTPVTARPHELLKQTAPHNTETAMLVGAPTPGCQSRPWTTFGPTYIAICEGCMIYYNTSQAAL